MKVKKITTLLFLLFPLVVQAEIQDASVKTATADLVIMSAAAAPEIKITPKVGLFEQRRPAEFSLATFTVASGKGSSGNLAVRFTPTVGTPITATPGAVALSGTASKDNKVNVNLKGAGPYNVAAGYFLSGKPEQIVGSLVLLSEQVIKADTYKISLDAAVDIP